MRDIENGELGDALLMKKGGAPGNGGTPIMSGEKDFFLAELIGNGDDVGDQFRDRVRSNAGWFAAEIVAALVGDDDSKSRGGQRLDLSVPSIPEFREAMEKKDDGAVLGASSNRVQAYGSIFE